ncbi:MAG: repeat domain protein [Myxococcales bacterium]|nr:repeat domain protein [Myxococcales bacterium]
MPTHLYRMALVAALLGGCSMPNDPSDVASVDDPLLCKTCGGDGDPPPLVTCYRDNDRDGLGAGSAYKLASCTAGYVTNHADCNDSNAAVTLGSRCYRDADGDGFGNASSYVYACAACPSGYVADASDCNDGSAATHPQTCELDLDGDGYTKPATTCVSSCPAAARQGDCDDGNASIHPEKYEIIENGIDDNCNRLVDESEFNYSDATFAGTTSLTLDFALESVTAANRARSGQPLWALVTYAAMSNTGTNMQWFGAVATSPPPMPNASPRGRVVVPALQPETPYMLEVLLYTDAQRTNALSAGPGYLSADGATSVVYLAMTKSVSSDPVAQARPALFLRSFIELESSRTGVVKGGNPYCPGYNCDVDHGGDEWCSEFYNYSIDIAYRDIQTYGHAMYTPDIINAFSNAGNWNEGSPALFSLHMGDFLGIGPVGGIHHAAMFVAYDQAQGKAWAINGNVGNRVALSTYDNSLIGGFGVLNASMLK